MGNVIGIQQIKNVHYGYVLMLFIQHILNAKLKMLHVHQMELIVLVLLLVLHIIVKITVNKV